MIVTVGGKPGAIGASIPSPTPISVEMGGVTSAWAFYGVNTQPVGHEPGLNLIAGPYIAIAGVDNPAKSRVDITISGQAPPGQTPWLSQIDAAAHSLINLDFLQFKDGGSAAILSNAAPISISSGQAMFVGAKGNVYVSSGASLTQRISIDTAGHVAISAADDGAIVLSAAGRIKSSSGGFVFPDNTTQITAAVAGVTGVTASAPLASSGGATPNITMTSPLPVANGGTGSTAPSLVAGANVVISGTWPNQTISSTGGSGGAQTPWLSDIDGASHNLLNAASVGATAGASLALKTSALSRLSIDTQGHVSISKPDAGAATSLLVADEIRVTTTGANANVVVYGPAGSNRNLLFGDTVNGVRWSFACDNSAESGGNIGSAFFIARWSDTGGYIDAPLYISRNDGTVTVKALYTSGQINANKVVLASGGSLQFGDGTIQTTAATGSGGSQTPWTQNINAASFQLQNAGRIGIGTSSPASGLVVTGNASPLTALINGAIGAVQVAAADGAFPEIGFDGFGTNICGLLTFRCATGTNAAKAPVALGQYLGQVRAYGYGNTTYGATAPLVGFLSTQAFTDTAKGAAIVFRVTPNNGTTQIEAMRIDQSGFVGIGTTTPAFPLDVFGVSAGHNVCIRQAVNAAQIRLSAQTGKTQGIYFFDQDTPTMCSGFCSGGIPGSPVGGDIVGVTYNTTTGWIERLRVLNSNGNVGIGTASPGSLLTVNGGMSVGNTIFKPASGNLTLTFQDGAPSFTTTLVQSPTLLKFSNNAAAIEFDANTNGGVVNQLVLATSGFVGIGNAAPANLLTVIPAGNPASAATATQLAIGEASNNAAYRMLLGFYVQSGTTWTGCIQVNGGSVAPLVLNPLGGNVGIGTTVPGQVFVVSKNAATPRAMSYSDGIQYVGADAQMAQLSLDSYGAQGSLVNFRCASGTLAAPGAVVASQILGQVNGMGWNGSGYAQSACIQFISQANWNTANTATSIVFDVTRQSTTGIFEVMRISAAGQGCVGIQQAAPAYPLEMGVDTAMKTATSTWLVASDVRLKRNIRNLEGGLSVIRKLRPVEAEYNGLANTIDGQRVVSFVADEVRSIVPHAVGSARRRLRKDDADETDVLDLNIHEILMHAILAIQQLAAAQPALRSS